MNNKTFVIIMCIVLITEIYSAYQRHVAISNLTEHVMKYEARVAQEKLQEHLEIVCRQKLEPKDKETRAVLLSTFKKVASCSLNEDDCQSALAEIENAIKAFDEYEKLFKTPELDCSPFVIGLHTNADSWMTKLKELQSTISTTKSLPPTEYQSIEALFRNLSE